MSHALVKLLQLSVAAHRILCCVDFEGLYFFSHLQPAPLSFMWMRMNRCATAALAIKEA